MSSRRGAVKINPVTGKLEKLTVSASADGVNTHRDGCMVVDDRYVNAAKELGLGGAGGMYSHIKALKRMGAADIPDGTSIQKEGAARNAANKDKPSVDVTDSAAVAKAVASAMKTANKGVGAAKVHGFAGSGSSRAAVHNHEDSFQKRKGVVNTIGGAKDVTRQTKDEAPRLPAKGERKGAQIMGFSTLDAHTAEGKARREAAEKRESAGNGYKPTAVHVSGGGGRGPVTHTLGGPVYAKDLPGPVSAAAHHKAAPSVPVEPARKASLNVLGGNAAASNVQPLAGDDLRAKRAAYFEKMAAEAEAKKKAGAAKVGM